MEIQPIMTLAKNTRKVDIRVNLPEIVRLNRIIKFSQAQRLDLLFYLQKRLNNERKFSIGRKHFSKHKKLIRQDLIDLYRKSIEGPVEEGKQFKTIIFRKHNTEREPFYSIPASISEVVFMLK